MRRVRCESCQAVVIWARHSETRRWMPLDADVVVDGTWQVEWQSDEDGAYPALVYDASGRPGHVSHFASCPFADEHRGAGQLSLLEEVTA